MEKPEVEKPEVEKPEEEGAIEMMQDMAESVREQFNLLFTRENLTISRVLTWPLRAFLVMLMYFVLFLGYFTFVIAVTVAVPYFLLRVLFSKRSKE